jgi:hypothetical protein
MIPFVDPISANIPIAEALASKTMILCLLHTRKEWGYTL